MGRDGANSWMLRCLYNNVHIFGVRGASVLRAQAGQPALSIALLRVDSCSGFTISDIVLDGNWGNSVGGTDSQAGINHTTQADPKSHTLMLYINTLNVLVSRVEIRQAYGDGLWMGGGQPSSVFDIRVENTTIDMCARNGISIGGQASRIAVHNVKITNPYTTAFDGEPVSESVHDVTIGGRTHLGTWWGVNQVTRNTLSISGGGIGPQNLAENWTVTGCYIEGNVYILYAKGIHLKDNTIVAASVDGLPPIVCQSTCDDVWIEDNYLYDRSNYQNSMIFVGVISIISDAGSSFPFSVNIRGNKIRARNGKHGIYLLQLGGKPGTSGVATATSALTVTDGAASWTVNQWAGHRIRIGTACSIVVSNTATIATLVSDGWTDVFGVATATPGAAAYIIDPTGGVIDVDGNEIDCMNDGSGVGGNGIKQFPGYPGMRLRIRNNKIHGATGGAISIQGPGVAGNAGELLEIAGNFAWDDQPVVTCTAVINFVSSTNLGKLILRNNQVGTGVPAVTTGLTSGTWLVDDGEPSEWAGFGSPEGVVTAKRGARFARKDGGAGACSYVKESDTTNTGWVAK